MNYIKVIWKHSDSQYPSLLYSQLDENRWETRKVEIYADGRRDFASSSESSGDTRLGIEPVPLLEEIAGDPAFEPFEIEAAEFEQIWTDVRRAKLPF